MELNEIKKALYKEKPDAEIVGVSKVGIFYSIPHSVDGVPVGLSFLVPLSDIGDATFEWKTPAHLLIRYMIKDVTY